MVGSSNGSNAVLSTQDNMNRTISLQDYRITQLQLPPIAIPALARTLVALNLRNNHLTTLPPDLFSLACLETLDVRDNFIWALSPSIVRLSRLQALHLRNNKLEALPAQLLEMDALRTFDCGENPITDPPKEIWKALAPPRTPSHPLAPPSCVSAH